MKPDPAQDITPEGRRAAEKVRTLFLLIAAANIVLVAIVLWSRHTAGDSLRPEEMKRVVSRTIAAYCAKERAAFLESFSTAAEPRADAAFFDSVILGEYHRDFGTVMSSKPLQRPADSMTRDYELVCEKQPRVRLTVKFVREDGGEKLVLWRMERSP